MKAISVRWPYSFLLACADPAVGCEDSRAVALLRRRPPTDDEIGPRLALHVAMSPATYAEDILDRGGRPTPALEYRHTYGSRGGLVATFRVSGYTRAAYSRELLADLIGATAAEQFGHHRIADVLRDGWHLWYVADVLALPETVGVGAAGQAEPWELSPVDAANVARLEAAEVARRGLTLAGVRSTAVEVSSGPSYLPPVERSSLPRLELVSIGYRKRSPRGLMDAAKAAGARVVVDVRAQAETRDPTWRRESLGLAAASAGLGYEWIGGLAGNPAHMRAGLTWDSPEVDIRRALERFRGYLLERGGARVGMIARELLALQERHGGPVALLCACGEHRLCHRSVVAEEVAATLAETHDVTVRTIGPERGPDQLGLFPC